MPGSYTFMKSLEKSGNLLDLFLSLDNYEKVVKFKHLLRYLRDENIFCKMKCFLEYFMLKIQGRGAGRDSKTKQINTNYQSKGLQIVLQRNCVCVTDLKC